MRGIARARTMGGSIGISICASLLNNHLKDGLERYLAQQYIDALLASASMGQRILPELPPFNRRVYSEGYRHQAINLTVFKAVVFLVVC